MLSTDIVIVFSLFSLYLGGVLGGMCAFKSTIHAQNPLIDSLIFITFPLLGLPSVSEPLGVLGIPSQRHVASFQYSMWPYHALA